MRIPLRLVVLLGVALLLGGCGGETKEQPSDAPGKAAAEDERVPGVTYDDHGEPAGVHRYRRWSANVGQGAQPVGDVAFENLKALGYTTILSVDGSVPDVEGAEKHGLRYVHVPIGYDGITKELGLKIVAAARLHPGPVFVHCHHGKHRGPAAAMLLRISEDRISNEEAVHGLETSQTSKGYKGLWRDVKAFEAPTSEELATIQELPSKVLPKGLRAGMVNVNHRYDFLKLSQESGWKQPKDHPDVDPPHEARMLWELYREMARTDTECRDKGEIFLAYLKEGEDAAIALEKAIRAGDTKTADKHFEAVKANCADCHRDYRN